MSVVFVLSKIDREGDLLYCCFDMSSTRTPEKLLIEVQKVYDDRIGGKGKNVSSELFSSILEDEQKNPDIHSAILTVALLALQANNETENNEAHRIFAILVSKLTKKDKRFLLFLTGQIRSDYPVAGAVCLAQRRRLHLVDDFEEEKWQTAQILLSTKRLTSIFGD